MENKKTISIISFAALILVNLSGREYSLFSSIASFIAYLTWDAYYGNIVAAIVTLAVNILLIIFIIINYPVILGKSSVNATGWIYPIILILGLVADYIISIYTNIVWCEVMLPYAIWDTAVWMIVYVAIILGLFEGNKLIGRRSRSYYSGIDKYPSENGRRSEYGANAYNDAALGYRADVGNYARGTDARGDAADGGQKERAYNANISREDVSQNNREYASQSDGAAAKRAGDNLSAKPAGDSRDDDENFGFCTNCGADITDKNSRFCENCGNRLDL